MADTTDRRPSLSNALLENDMLFKVLIVGDSGVGKSCLLIRYTDDAFSDCHIATIGVDFKIQTIQMDGKLIKLNMWDTAGQERFRTITQAFYRGTHGVILVFDLTDMDTFTRLPTWLSEIERYTQQKVAMMLVGNKADLKDKRVVDFDVAQDYANKLAIPYLETSAKLSTNVEQAFLTMTAEMKNRVDAGQLIQNSYNPPLRSGSSITGKWYDCAC